jgi:hypothetical protein
MVGHGQRKMKPRVGEVITTTPETIRWQKGEEILEARWEDITLFYPRKDEFVLVLPGKDEPEITFLPLISNIHLLKAIATHYVAREKHQESRDNDEIATVKTHGTPIWGAQSFGYQTRSARFLLWCFTGLFGLTNFVPLLMQAIAMEPKPLSVGAFIPFMVFDVLVGVAWWWHLGASIEVDDLKITLRYPWGTRSIPWLMVESLSLRNDYFSFTLFLRNGKRVCIPFPARRRELEEAIRKHLPLATH